MQPLLKIENIPINIEYKTQRAALQNQSTPAKVNVTRSRGSLGIQQKNAQVKIDSYEARASAGLKSTSRSIKEFADRGVQAGYEATAKYAQEGTASVYNTGKNAYIQIKADSTVPQVAETALTFMPSVGPEISADPGYLTFDVSVDRLNFDWSINNRPQLEYVPGGMEFAVTQYPEVVIEYMGGPIYVPPSADPNYEPPPGIDASI